MKHVIGGATLALLVLVQLPVSTMGRGAFAGGPRAAAAESGPTIEAFLSPAYPQDLVAARKADRLAWWAYERGQRNVFTAAAPDFKPIALTHFTDDNGIDISDLAISDDGALVTFVRGTQPNREGWVANPTSDARGADRTVWAALTASPTTW
jgi:dipeptidyl-peptidase 4